MDHQLLQTRNKALKETIMRRNKGVQGNIVVGNVNEHYPSLDMVRLVIVGFTVAKVLALMFV